MADPLLPPSFDPAEQHAHMALLTEVPRWAWAILLCVLSGALTTLGLTLQKRSYMDNERLPGHARREASAQSRWQLGMLVFLTGQVIGFSALGFAPQSLVATVSSLTLVFNTMLVPALLGHRVFNRRYVDAWTVLAMLGGCVLVVTTQRSEQQSFRLHQIVSLYAHPAFFVFLAVLGAFLLAALLRIAWRPREPPSSWLAIVVAADCSALVMIFAKCFVHMLRRILVFQEYTAQFASVWTYVIMGALVASVFLNVYFVNLALRRGLASDVLPAYYALSALLSIAGGTLFFHEFQHLTLVNAAVFVLGVLLVVLGIFYNATSELQLAISLSARAQAGPSIQFVDELNDSLNDSTASSASSYQQRATAEQHETKHPPPAVESKARALHASDVEEQVALSDVEAAAAISAAAAATTAAAEPPSPTLSYASSVDSASHALLDNVEYFSYRLTAYRGSFQHASRSFTVAIIGFGVC
jgi:drug/metabolite transporter (DMT)-like permease